jgi:hypothetical protein
MLISGGAGQSFILLNLARALAVLFLKICSAPPLISVISLRFARHFNLLILDFSLGRVAGRKHAY